MMKHWDESSLEEKRLLIEENYEDPEDLLIDKMGAFLHSELIAQGKSLGLWDLATKRKKIEEFINTIKEKIIQKICIERNYCRVIKGLDKSKRIDFAVTIADSLFSFFIKFPVPIFFLSVYLIKYILNKMCGC